MAATTYRVDLNADLGEGARHDDELLEIVTSANVCSGAYAGDATHTRATMLAAETRGVRLGAHVGYPDRARFGRASMGLPLGALRESLAQQFEECAEAARLAGGRLAFVKPHGALYHDAGAGGADAHELAQLLGAFAKTYRLQVVHQRDTPLARAAVAAGCSLLVEGFADRRYLPNGRLAPRSQPDALVEDPRDAAQQAIALVRGEVPGVARVDTICVHGDHPGALATARAVRAALLAQGVRVEPPRQS